MTINYTTLLGLALPVTGTESGTWGDDVNLGITDYLDIAIAGTNNITNDSDITLSTTNGSSVGSNIVASPNSTTAQYMQLLCTGARTADRNINAPNVSKMYVVNNSTTGGYSIVIRGVTGPTTGVTVANGEKAIVYWSSVLGDFVKITSTVITNFTGTLSTANGGTGLGGSTPFTANGVVYASSTSALATGSGITYNGTLLTLTNTGSLGYIINSTGGGTSAGAGGYFAFQANGTYKGILGPSSVVIGAGTDQSLLLQSYSDNIYFSVGSGKYTAFQNNGTEQMRLDSSGNLGLGVTPSAWNASRKVIQLNSTGGALTVSSDQTTELWSNSYINASGNVIYIQNGYANLHQINKNGTGSYAWYTAPSGMAGTTATLTQAMTLDNSGNLGLGVIPSNPTRFNIGYDSTTISTNNFITIQNRGTGTTDSTNTYPIGGLMFSGYRDVRNPANIAGVWAVRSPGPGGSSSNGNLIFGTAFAGGGNITQDGSSGLPTEAMRIDSSGNLLVGTTSAGSYLSGGNIVSPGVFTSYQGYATCAYPGATDVYTFANGYSGVFLISGRQLSAPNGGIYALALVTVGIGTGTLTVASLTNASCIFGVSGTARTVNLTNTAGGSLGLSFSIICLNAS